MNTSDSGGNGGRTGGPKKAVSIQASSEACSTPAAVQESTSSSQPQTSVDFLCKTQFSASHFSGAHNFVSNGGTFSNFHILGNYIAVAESSDADSQTRSSNGIIKDFPVIAVGDVSIEREIYKGCEYRLHTAKLSGNIVAMKVYEGNSAHERCSKSARFNQKLFHPNIPQMIGVSPLKSHLSYLIFDGEYEGAVHDILGQALKKDLRQILILGLQTVIGLALGFDYLQDLKYPLASVGLHHFVVLSRKGKPVISFDPDELSQINQSDHQPYESNSAEIVFHKLCERTFDDACKAHYESQEIQRADAYEFDANVNDLPKNRFEELDSSSTAPSSGRLSPRISPRKLLPNGRRQELVWKSPTAEAVSLNDISQQFQNFLKDYHLSPSEPSLNRRRGRYTARTAHRCPGYNRIEITLTANITRSAIVSHSSPIPHEICSICKEVVKDTVVFNCLCGGDDDESIPTIRCTSCSEWHHRPCVIALDVESPTFVCECCLRSAKQTGPTQQTHPLNASPLPALIDYDDLHPGIYDNSLPSNIHYTSNETVYRQRGPNHYAAPSYAIGGFQDAPKKKYTANPLSTSDQRLAPTLYSSHQLIHTPSELADTYSSYHHQMAPNSQTPEPLIIFEHVSRTGSGGMFQSPLADASANEAGKQQQEFNNTFDLRSLDDVFGTPPHQAQPLPTEIPTPSYEADTQELWDYWEWYMLTPPSSPGSDAGENFVRDQPSPIPFRSIPSPDIFRTVPFPKIRSLNIVDLAEFEGG